MNLTHGHKRWLIIALFLVCYTVLYMDRSNMSIAGPEMMKHFEWSATDFGIVSTSFFIGYACSMLIGGWLADKFGGGKLVTFGALWWSVFVFLTPFASSLTAMITVRILMGIGEGVALPAMSSMVAKWMPKKETGLAQGICFVGVPLGITITMPLAEWITTRWSWEMAFWAFSFIAPVWVVLWKLFGWDKPEQDPTISKEELEYILSDHESKTHSSLAKSGLSARDIFSTKSVWTGAVAFFCANYLFYLFMTWLPTYFVKGRGFDLHQSAIYSMMPYIAAIFTYPIGGYLADKASSKFGQNFGRKIIPCIGLVAAGTLLILGSQAHSVVTAVIFITASNGLLCLTMGGFYSMPMVFSHSNAGTITGFWATWATIGGISAPLLTGMIVDKYSYMHALYCGALISIVGALVLWMTCRVEQIVPQKHLKKEEVIV